MMLSWLSPFLRKKNQIFLVYYALIRIFAHCKLTDRKCFLDNKKDLMH